MRWVVVFALMAAPAVGLRAGDCNGNGAEDLADVRAGRSADCNANGVPDECDVRPVNYGLAIARRLPIAFPFPGSLLAEDLDGDARPDLAILDREMTSVAVLWNTGGFEASQVVAAGVRIASLAVADLDADGDGDFALAGGGAVAILLNSGSGAFAGNQRLALELDPVTITSGDLDGDRAPDLAVAGSFRVQVVWNRPGGSFQPGEVFSIGSDPRVAAIFDANGDGDADLVTGNALGNISLVSNRGNGSFWPARHLAAGGPVVALAPGDFNGDGRLDLAALAATDQLSLFINPGDLAAGRAESRPVLRGAADLEAADLDRDGDLDLAVAHEVDGTLVLLNDGRGEFIAPRTQRAFDGRSMAVADFDGDVHLDVALLDRSTDTLLFVEGRSVAYDPDCNGSGIPDDCEVEGNDCNGNRVPDECDLAIGRSADCNRNRRPDECEGDCNENGVPDDCDVASGESPDCNANGIPDACDVRARDFTFEPSQLLQGDLPEEIASLAAGDVDGDGDLDLVAAGASGLTTFFQQGGGTFVPGEPLSAEGALSAAVVDLDGDEFLDLAAAGSSGLAIFANRGRGAFRPLPPVSFDHGFSAIAAVDVDLDGDADLVLRGWFPAGFNTLTVVENDGRGVFVNAGSYEVTRGTSPFLLGGDLDADGFTDLITGGDARTISILRNRRDGTFAPAESVSLRWGASSGVAADWNGDGHLDLALGNSGLRLVTILYNDGRGMFPDPGGAHVGANVRSLSAADLDRDGDMDLAVLALNEFEEDEFETQVVALLNDGRGEFPERRRLFLERFSLARDLVLFDADGDGDQDAGLAERPFCDRCGASAVRLSLLWNRSEPPASRDRNHDRIPDECGRPLFHRGDATADGGLDAADAVLVLAAAFLSPGPVPGCLEAADANNDGRIDLTDALVILNFVFLGGAAPAFPGPGGSPCDADPDAPGSPRDLGCRAYPPCG